MVGGEWHLLQLGHHGGEQCPHRHPRRPVRHEAGDEERELPARDVRGGERVVAGELHLQRQGLPRGVGPAAALAERDHPAEDVAGRAGQPGFKALHIPGGGGSRQGLLLHPMTIQSATLKNGILEFWSNSGNHQKKVYKHIFV